MEEHPRSGARGLGPLLAAALALALIGAVAVWLPIGPTSSGPEPTFAIAPELVDATTTTTTTTAPPSEAQGGLGTTATTQAFPPPHPPGPFEVRTSLGHLVLRAFDVPPRLGEGLISAVAERQDGTLVALVAGPDGAWMLEEVEGELRERPATGIAPDHYPWRALATPLGLAAASVGHDGPAIWIEAAPGRFERWRLEMPAPPAPWLRPHTDLPAMVVGPGGLEVFGGQRGWGIDWARLVGAEYAFDEYWSLELGELVVWKDGTAKREYEATVDHIGDVLHVRVRDRVTGDLVAEESVVTEHAAAIAAAATSYDHHAFGRIERTPLRWQVREPGEFRLVERGALPGRVDSFEQTVIWTGDRYIAAETVWDSTPHGSSRLLVSEDGITWDDVTPDVGTEHVSVSGLAHRDGQVGVLVHAEGRHQIADRVSVVGTFTSVYTSHDLVNWSGAPLGDSSAHDVHDLSAGPLGWVASGSRCEPECEAVIWLSADGVEWEQVGLGSTEMIAEQGSLYVGADRLAWPAYSSRRSRALIWVAELEARRG